MKNQPNADVEDYLLSYCRKRKNSKRKNYWSYTGGDIQLRMLFIDAKKKELFIKNGLYFYLVKNGQSNFRCY